MPPWYPSLEEYQEMTPEEREEVNRRVVEYAIESERQAWRATFVMTLVAVIIIIASIVKAVFK